MEQLIGEIAKNVGVDEEFHVRLYWHCGWESLIIVGPGTAAQPNEWEWRSIILDVNRLKVEIRKFELVKKDLCLHLNPERRRTPIAALQRGTDIVICYLHWAVPNGCIIRTSLYSDTPFSPCLVPSRSRSRPGFHSRSLLPQSLQMLFRQLFNQNITFYLYDGSCSADICIAFAVVKMGGLDLLTSTISWEDETRPRYETVVATHPEAIRRWLQLWAHFDTYQLDMYSVRPAETPPLLCWWDRDTWEYVSFSIYDYKFSRERYNLEPVDPSFQCMVEPMEIGWWTPRPVWEDRQTRRSKIAHKLYSSYFRRFWLRILEWAF